MSKDDCTTLPSSFDPLYFAKFDQWSKKEAALILCGFDPDQYRGITLSPDKYPEEIHRAYLLYRIFRSVDFKTKFGYEWEHPLAYLTVAQEKGWSLDEKWQMVMDELHQQVKDNQRIADEKTATDIVDEKGKKYILKTLGAMTMLYIQQQNKPKYGITNNEHLTDNFSSKVNLSSIVDDIMDFLANHELDSYGLGKSSLFDKLALGLRWLERERN